MRERKKLYLRPGIQIDLPAPLFGLFGDTMNVILPYLEKRSLPFSTFIYRLFIDISALLFLSIRILAFLKKKGHVNMGSSPF